MNYSSIKWHLVKMLTTAVSKPRSINECFIAVQFNTIRTLNVTPTV